ncbi:MAG: hypothetical protein JNL38_16595 [Myxococcales bacterium]|nr:hypothetical protein [Myxococcales bacterium]
MKLARRSALASAILFALSCTDDVAPPSEPKPPTEPGEICDPANSKPLRLSFDPPEIVVAPGQIRRVRLTVEPDVCLPTVAKLVTDNAGVTAAPEDGKFDLRHATYDFNVTGGAIGATSIRARMERAALNPSGDSAEAALPVEVRDPALPKCSPGEATKGELSGAAAKLPGTGGLKGAELGVNAKAFARTDELALPTFASEVACGEDLTPSVAKMKALGPAVKFTAEKPINQAMPLRRELDFAIPVNPAAFPAAARLRHVQVLFKNDLRAKKARPIVVANPRVEKAGDGYVLRFSSPWLGTYQAAALEDAGTNKRKRRVTHRAVMGFSMGGGGAASFGVRHHDKFDVIEPLGGPSDWTWLLWFIENYAMGGFCPAGQPGCAKTPPNQYPMPDTFAHSMDWNHWWYQEGSGNGGHFPRDEYIQIFEDLAIMQGNPNGQNADPKLAHMAPGPKDGDPWVNGDRGQGRDCTITVDPISGRTAEEKQREGEQKQLESQCKAARCNGNQAIWKAPKNFFDDEYNPDGSLPVIAFCDGSPQQKDKDPYQNTWAPPPTTGAKPVNIVLAVDRNNNGVRDEDEPVIRSGHEPYDDVGADGKANKDEPGYDPVTNPDPNQDDYDYQINPTGTEGNHRYEAGEPFRDFGLDGVPFTADRHVAGDVGEGDGVYTESEGLKNFYSNDAHGIIRRWNDGAPGGPLTDDALRRVDFFTDGGVRDLFNFAAVANHFQGAVAARTNSAGVPIRTLAYYNNFHFLPGQDKNDPINFAPSRLRWADIADMPSVRYGDVDASASDIAKGDGQHVGTALQLLWRLQFGFYFASQRWPDADRRLIEVGGGDNGENYATETKNELGVDCERKGHCEKIFTGPKTRRVGPIAVTLPPGYTRKESAGVRYPVMYVLHGYGQDPRDLEALAIITNNFMNSPEQSYATRLAKFIVVYVDGRCREHKDGKGNVTPECIRGTFYLNSNRKDTEGRPMAQMDSWFDEVIDYVDQNYRTLPPADVEVSD